MSDMYRDELMFEAKNPRHRGVIHGADITERKANPSCGDVVTVSVKLEGEKVKEMKFDGQGCVISMAGASFMAGEVKGRALNDILALSKDDVVKSTGVDVGPMRESCLMLGLEALKRGITVWKQDLK